MLLEPLDLIYAGRLLCFPAQVFAYVPLKQKMLQCCCQAERLVLATDTQKMVLSPQCNLPVVI